MSIKIDNFEPMKAVYCYHFPEIRKFLHEVEKAIPDEMYFVTSKAGDIEKSLSPLFKPPLIIPKTNKGTVDLDEIHVPIIERIVKAYSTVVPGLKEFNHVYPTSGSSEGIFHLLAQLRTKEVKTIYVLEGEYEGYEAQASNLGLEIKVVKEKDMLTVEKGVWFISNPSAREGNIIPNERIIELANKGNKLILDLAYVGSTKPYVFEVSHENIIAAVMSFSKPYGVFRSRIGGFVYAREEVPSLYGNKWFKDVLRLLQALKLAEEIGPNRLYDIYAPIQTKIVEDLNKRYDLPLKKSDALLLAHIQKEDANRLSVEQLKMIQQFKRGEKYRFCLTPYFEHNEQK